MICGGKAGALVDQTCGALVGAFVPRPSKPGMDAAATNNVPPSPWELVLTASAAPSLVRNERNCGWPCGRPLGAPRFSGAELERIEFVAALAGSLESEPAPPRRPEDAPKRPRSDGAPAIDGGAPALAKRRRFVSAMRTASGSRRALVRPHPASLASVHSLARFRFGEPVKRGPITSVR